MNCPACKKNEFRKIKNQDNTHYYRCAACGYETQTITPNHKNTKEEIVLVKIKKNENNSRKNI